MTRLHPDELTVDVAGVRRLVERSFPDLAGLSITEVGASGSSNSLYRLGDAHAVRLPRQPGGGAGIAKEAAWLPHVASGVTVDVPRVVGLGSPGPGYGEVWAVTSWLDGTVPRDRLRGAGSSAVARDLARFLRELRDLAVPAGAIDDAALSGYRGDPLPHFDADFRELVDQCRGLDLDLDLDAASRVWDEATAAAAGLAPELAWYHGDLVAENLLLDDRGRLAAVLDFGGLGLGSTAVDLVVAWDLLDAGGRATFRRALGIDDARWSAGRGWALFLALMTFPYYGASMPDRCAARLAMAQAVLVDSRG